MNIYIYVDPVGCPVGELHTLPKWGTRGYHEILYLPMSLHFSGDPSASHLSGHVSNTSGGWSECDI